MNGRRCPASIGLERGSGPSLALKGRLILAIMPSSEVVMRRALAFRFLVCAAVAAPFVGRAPDVAAEPNGIPACTAAGDQLRPVIVSDGLGGAIVAWHDERPGAAAGGVCYAQRVNASGAPQWTLDGVALSTTGDSNSPVIAPDPGNGA